MARIDELRKELDSLEGLQRRADKLRGKRGRLDVSQETLDEIEGALGSELITVERPDGTFQTDIETLVELIDHKLAK